MFTEEILSANLAALERAQGQRPAIGPLDAGSFRVVATANGPGLEVRAAQGHWVPYNGPRISRPGISVAAAPTQLFMIGAGLGTALDPLEGVGDPTRVVVVEPDPGIAALLLARRDWRAWIDRKSLRVLVGPQYAGASTCARDVDVTNDPVVLTAPELAEHRPSLVRAAEAVARRVISEAQSNANARKRFAGRYLLQTLRNLDVIGSEGDAASLEGRFAGVPALLVAAGPSLDDNIVHIRRLQDRAVIIAVDTALRPLLAAGVKPHLVVAVDPAEANAAHLAGVAAASESYLVAEASLHPSTFPGFQGRTFVFRVSSHQPWPWLHTLGVDRGVLRAWGSVLTSAFDLAMRMGSDPIVFAGTDLAYTDGRPYCRGTIYESLWAYWHRRGTQWDQIWALLTKGGVATVPDMHGRPVKTAPHLLAFRNWLLEQMAAAPGRRFVNVTGGGVLYGPAVEQSSVRAALSGTSIGQLAREGLAAAHAQRTIARLRKPAAALAADIRNGTAADVLADWIAFTADTVAAEDIIAALPDPD